MTVTRHYILAAGGTGGHMMPAFALGEELVARGHRVALITDERGARIPGTLDKADVHVLPAGRIAGGPIGWMRAALAIRDGRAMALKLYRAFQPAMIIGFGGYPALPALLAARAAGVPSLIHEQNAVMGRVNRLVAPWVDAIATSFPDTQRLSGRARAKTHLVGNPVRSALLAIRDAGFAAPTGDAPLHVLVTGGSQGATVLSDVVPAGLALLPATLRARLRVVQQCRAEDIEPVRARYAAMGIAAELATYLEDLPARIGWAHLVIARAGASTVAELAAAGRPAILVPLPSATDDHQRANAREMAATGGARTIDQADFTPEALAEHVRVLASAKALTGAARGAAKAGRPHATRDLADLVEQSGGAPLMDVIRVGGKPPRRAGVAGAVAARGAETAR